MTLPTWYDTGTASVANGSTTVTGVGSLWGGDAIMAGDLFCDPAQPMVPPQRIEAVTGNGALTLAAPWPGTSIAGGAYEIRYVGIIERSTATNRRTLELLAGRAFFDPDATGTLVQRANYDTEAKGFSFLNIATDPMTLYFKASDTSGDWSAGVAFGRGPTGAGGTLSVGTVTTGAAGSSASVTNVGTAQSAVFDITIPRGNTGAAGADGRDPGILLTWSTTTTDADPGNGIIRANNASLASATTLFVDNLNRAGSSIAAYLAGLASSTSPIKGTLVLTSTTNTQATFNVTGVTVATGYVKVAVSGHSGATAFTNASAVSFQFSRTGNAGAGSGDVTGAASSVAGRIAVFRNTSGKEIDDSGKALSDFYERSAVDAKVLAAQDPVDRVAAVPSLDLVLTGLGAILPEWFTRASTGTYVDSAGVLRTAAANEPRYEYDLMTGVCLGLLAEEQRTNLIPGSRSPGGADGSWTPSNVTVTLNADTAPDGTQQATKITENTNTGTHQLLANIAGKAAGVDFWNSVFVKKTPGSARNIAQIWCGSFANHTIRSSTNINLDTGELTGGSGAGAWEVRAAPAGNGWWRVFLKGQSAGTGSIQLVVSLTDAGATNYAGNGVSSLLVWGYDQQDGLSPGSHIPTTTAAATRAADVLIVPVTNWFNPSAGTVFVEFSLPVVANPSTSYPLILGGVSNNYVSFEILSNGVMRTRSVVDGAAVFSPTLGPISAKQIYRAATAFRSGSYAASMNGAAAVTSGTQVGVPIITSVSVGGFGGGAGAINGHARRVVVFPTRLSDTELQALTA